ncbi:protein charlatan [Ostrinia furnacalis]|uniref:protein charlatan n=1 Tax=Ostrinia furnacalis TaxID=93504 RepID=UPI00103F129D|nr:protein charlatan [Ostrinia furnacalis]
MMEGGPGAGVASLTMDCEDMFKEITKKLYGEEAVGVGVVGVEFPAAERDLDEDLRPEESLTAWGLAALMQNGFPPPGILQANFTPRIDPSAEDRWSAAEEPLAWAHSRIASYNPAQRLFKCADCECVGFMARIAEHWLGTHSQARAFQCPVTGCGFASGWARGVRSHLARDHHSDPAAADHLLRDNAALDDLTRYLNRLKAKVEQARNERRNSVGTETAQVQAEAGAGAGEAGKRYACGACPYATDRRDLFTRHENIHRDEKPFHCYLCQKQFNRADHVKKHFLRMHRDQPYDLNRIRRAQPKPQPAAAPAPAPTQALHYYTKPPAEPPPPPPLEFRPAPPAPAAPPGPPPAAPPPVKLERAPLAKAEPALVPHPGHPSHPAHPAHPALHKQAPPAQPPQPPPAPAAVATSSSPVRRKGERRYACCYCSWSGVDNWCLKRHLNTHLKPFACALCEYKAARAERLATHVHKVHNKKSCGKCNFLADDQHQLAHHLRETHHIEHRNLKVPTGVGRVASGSFSVATATVSTATDAVTTVVTNGVVANGVVTNGVVSNGVVSNGVVSNGVVSNGVVSNGVVSNGVVSNGVVSNGVVSNGTGAPAVVAGVGVGGGAADGGAGLFGYLEASDGSGDEYEGALGGEFAGAAGPQHGAAPHYARDKENAAPLHHAVHHEHCLRY